MQSWFLCAREGLPSLLVGPQIASEDFTSVTLVSPAFVKGLPALKGIFVGRGDALPAKLLDELAEVAL